MLPLVRESPLKIVPVLDLRSGQVVRAIAGRRSEYEPWYSPLSAHADPLETAAALRDAVGHRELYVADIGAIEGAAPHWKLLQSLASDAALWCDTGIRSAQQARQLASTLGSNGQLGRVILASETASSLADVMKIIAHTPSRRLAFSLDWAGEQLRSTENWLDDSNWLDTVAALSDVGIDHFLLIDLERVGTDQGLQIAERCRNLRSRLPAAHITAGGGVAGLDDLHRLAQAGCDAALVATALHRQAGESCE